MIGKIVAVVLLPLAGFLGVVSVLVVLIGSLNPFNSLTDDAPAGGPAPGAPGVPGAVADIPADYLALYTRAAANCPGLDWSVLAAIGKIESDHGRSNLPGVHDGQNKAGARVIWSSQAGPVTWGTNGSWDVPAGYLEGVSHVSLGSA